MQSHRPPSRQALRQALSLVPTLPRLLALTLMLASAPAWSHGGEEHDHGATPATSPAALQAPRASAQTDTFELVAVLEPGDARHPPTLTLYLDRFDTNEPVAQASIDVESGAFKASAQAVGPGVYTVPGSAFAHAGRYPLTFTVQSGDTADLLDATLVTGAHAAHGSEPAQAATAAHARWPWLAAGTAVLIALGGGATVWTRRRRPARALTPDDSAHNSVNSSPQNGRHAAPL